MDDLVRLSVESADGRLDVLSGGERLSPRRELPRRRRPNAFRWASNSGDASLAGGVSGLGNRSSSTHGTSEHTA
jgi:hypothetical protein